MVDRTEAWRSGTPILHSLPANNYQNNEVTPWLTSWVDQELSAVITKLQGYHDNLEPTKAPEEQLDYLAWLVGLSGRYWSVQWLPEVKRKMTAAAYRLFNKSGTLEAVRQVLDIHGINYDVWVDGDLRLPFNIPGTFGEPKLRYYVRVSLAVSRNGRDWKEVERTIKNYSAAIVNGKVSYKEFYLGYSRLGDPIFKKAT